MADLLTNVGLFFKQFLVWATDLATAITGSPILLAFFAISIAGTGLAFFRKLIKTR